MNVWSYNHLSRPSSQHHHQCLFLQYGTVCIYHFVDLTDQSLGTDPLLRHRAGDSASSNQSIRVFFTTSLSHQHCYGNSGLLTNSVFLFPFFFPSFFSPPSHRVLPHPLPPPSVSNLQKEVVQSALQTFTNETKFRNSVWSQWSNSNSHRFFKRYTPPSVNSMHLTNIY